MPEMPADEELEAMMDGLDEQVDEQVLPQEIIDDLELDFEPSVEETPSVDDFFPSLDPVAREKVMRRLFEE